MQTNIMSKEFMLWGNQTPPLLPSWLRWQLGWLLGKHKDTLQVGDCPAESQLLRRRDRRLGLSPSCASGFLDILRTSA